jgi:hypothetical protein
MADSDHGRIAPSESLTTILFIVLAALEVAGAGAALAAFVLGR